MLFSNEQVQEQKQRFDNLLQSINLVKLGQRYFFFDGQDSGDGKYNAYCYILKVLRLLANVGGCYYCPGTNFFYNELIRDAAIRAYMDSVRK